MSWKFQIAPLARIALFFLILTALPLISFADTRKEKFVSGHILSQSSSGTFEHWADINGIFVTRDYAAAVELEYNLWTLAGSMVWGFRAKTAPLQSLEFHKADLLKGDIPISVLKIIADDSLPQDSVRMIDDRNVLVSRDLMDLAYIFDFTFLARRSPGALYQGATGSEGLEFSIYRNHQGISAPAGGWGWTVPGSPHWDSTFTYRSSLPADVTRESFDEMRMPALEAQQVMKRLLDEFAGDDSGAIQGLETGNYDVRVNELLHKIWKHEPDALRAMKGLPPGSSTDRASGIGHELSNVMIELGADIRESGATGDLAREAERIDEIFEAHSSKLPENLQQIWADMKAEALEDAADRQLSRVLRMASSLMTDRLRAGDREADDNVMRYLNQGRDYLRESAHVSDKMKERWESLETSIKPTGKSVLMTKIVPQDLSAAARFGFEVAIDEGVFFASVSEGPDNILVFERVQDSFRKVASFNFGKYHTTLSNKKNFHQGNVSIIRASEGNIIVKTSEGSGSLKKSASGWVREDLFLDFGLPGGKPFDIEGNKVFSGYAATSHSDANIVVSRYTGSELKTDRRFTLEKRQWTDYEDFGSEVHFSKNIVMVSGGKPYGEPYDTRSIPVYFLSEDGSEIFRLVPSSVDGKSGKYINMGFDGDVVAIETIHMDEEEVYSKSLRVFEREGNSWVHKNTFLEQTESRHRVGDLIVHSGIIFRANWNDSGRHVVEVFMKNGSEWQLSNTLIPKDGHSDDRFGRSIDAHGEKVIISAPDDNTAGEDVGAVYLLSTQDLQGVSE